MCRNVRSVFISVCAGFKDVCTCYSNSSCAFYLHLHMWETEVKVAETKQTAFPLVTSAAAVTFCPGRLGPGSCSASFLQSVI